MDLLLRGVEFGGDETGEGVVLESDGVLVRASGFRSATLRNLSNGDRWDALSSIRVRSKQQSIHLRFRT